MVSQDNMALKENIYQGPVLLKWVIFNPSMDK